MKNSTLKILLCATLITQGLTGCKENDSQPSPISTETKLYADMEYAYTGEFAVAWNDGDELGVFAAETQNGKFLLTGKADAVYGSFMGNITGIPETNYTYHAYYPYDAAATLQGAELSVKITETQTYSPGKFSAKQNPMVGVSNSTRTQMKNLCGLLSVSITAGSATTIRSITFKAAEGGGKFRCGHSVRENGLWTGRPDPDHIGQRYEHRNA